MQPWKGVEASPGCSMTRDPKREKTQQQQWNKLFRLHRDLKLTEFRLTEYHLTHIGERKISQRRKRLLRMIARPGYHFIPEFVVPLSSLPCVALKRKPILLFLSNQDLSVWDEFSVVFLCRFSQENGRVHSRREIRSSPTGLQIRGDLRLKTHLFIDIVRMVVIDWSGMFFSFLFFWYLYFSRHISMTVLLGA